jgi:hypothetical protein
MDRIPRNKANGGYDTALRDIKNICAPDSFWFATPQFRQVFALTIPCETRTGRERRFRGAR